MSDKVYDLRAIISSGVEAVGFKLWGVESHDGLLRVYIDDPNGVSLADCERASRQISALLDVEDPFSGRYRLEVSSPGIERSLFTLEQFQQYLGTEILVKTRQAVEGKRNFVGVLKAIDEQTITLQVSEEVVVLKRDNVRRARLVAHY